MNQEQQALLQAIGQMMDEKLDKRLSPLESDMQDIKSDIQVMKSDIQNLKDRMTGVENRMTGVENRMTGMETRMTGMETRMTRMETRMTGMENRMTGMENRMTGIEGRMDKIEERTLKTEVVLENDVSRNIKILMEGHGQLVSDVKEIKQKVSKLDDIENRLFAVEVTTKNNVRDIRELQQLMQAHG